jgi:hypothetical protein
MAELIEKEEGKEVEQAEEQEIEKIKLGEEEYTQDELQRYVELGKIGVEAEEKYNTKLDKVWPEFSKKSNELKEAQEKLEQLQEQIEQKVESGEQTPDEGIEKARQAAKKLGIVVDEDFEDMMGKSFRKYYLQERSAEKLLETAQSLEKEIDGKDGRPKFDTEEVLTFMSNNPGFKDLNRAYEAMHPEEMAEWRANKILEGKKKGLVTQEDTQSNKTPEEVKVNRGNLKDLISEIVNQ